MRKLRIGPVVRAGLAALALVAAGGCTKGPQNDCEAHCLNSPLGTRQVCGSNGVTYGSCEWMCGLAPTGVTVMPGACGSSSDMPPFPADGVTICDWVKVGTVWVAVDCAKNLGGVHTLGAIAGSMHMTMPAPVMTVADHRSRFGPVRQQGSAGSCTSFATVAGLEGQLAAQGFNLSLSEMHLWARYHIGDYETALAAAGQHAGLATQAAAAAAGLPYDGELALKWQKNQAVPDSGLLGRLDQQGIAQAGTVLVLQSMADVVTALLDGSDVLAAFNIDPQTWFATGPNGIIGDYSVSGPNADGHAVLLVGYATINGAPYFILRNSWGTTEWGDHGYGYLSQQTAAKNLVQAFIVSVHASQEPSAAPNCPTGQAADLDGHCYNICPNRALADSKGACPSMACPAGMVPDWGGTCVAACPTGTYSDANWGIACGPGGCDYAARQGVAGCTGTQCTAGCQAPNCQLYTWNTPTGEVLWTCLPL